MESLYRRSFPCKPDPQPPEPTLCPAVWADPPFFLSGASLSVGRPPPDRRKEPSRAKLVRLASKVAVTPHSFSRRCFRSRQAAKAQPTAWLSLSPCEERVGPGLGMLSWAHWTPGALGPSSQVLGDPGQSLCRSDLSEHLHRGTQMTALSENRKPATRVQDYGDSSKN